LFVVRKIVFILATTAVNHPSPLAIIHKYNTI
jgi:hypothetical protein